MKNIESEVEDKEIKNYGCAGIFNSHWALND